jgi:hypothetical protein
VSSVQNDIWTRLVILVVGFLTLRWVGMTTYKPEIPFVSKLHCRSVLVLMLMEVVAWKKSLA